MKLLRPKERLGFGYGERGGLHKERRLALTDALSTRCRRRCRLRHRRRRQPARHRRRRGARACSATSSPGRRRQLARQRGQAVEELWSATDAAGGAKGGAAAQLQRGWERDALLSLSSGVPRDRRPALSFALLADKWRVAPVTDTLIYRSERVRPELRRWVDDVPAGTLRRLRRRTLPCGRARPPTSKPPSRPPSPRARTVRSRPTAPRRRRRAALDDIAGRSRSRSSGRRSE